MLPAIVILAIICFVLLLVVLIPRDKEYSLGIIRNKAMKEHKSHDNRWQSYYFHVSVGADMHTIEVSIGVYNNFKEGDNFGIRI